LLGQIIGKEFAEKWKKAGTELNVRGQTDGGELSKR
jgi:hypothetical protein